MKQVWVAAVACVVLAGGSAWAQPAGMPQAGPEYKRMAYFAGEWKFTGEMKPGPMGPGGEMTFTESCQVMEGGFALVCEAEGKGPAGPTTAHSIMTYDADKKAYTYTAAESHMPVVVATGTVDGPTWTWTTDSMMEGKPVKTRVVVTEEKPDGYTFRMEMAVGDQPAAEIARGKATRTKT